MPILWGLLALAAVAIVWWASQVNWVAARGWYDTLPIGNKRVLTLLVAVVALLVLQSGIRLIFAEDSAFISLAVYGLLVAAILTMIYYSLQR